MEYVAPEPVCPLWPIKHKIDFMRQKFIIWTQLINLYSTTFSTSAPPPDTSSLPPPGPQRTKSPRVKSKAKWRRPQLLTRSQHTQHLPQSEVNIKTHTHLINSRRRYCSDVNAILYLFIYFFKVLWTAGGSRCQKGFCFKPFLKLITHGIFTHKEKIKNPFEGF